MKTITSLIQLTRINRPIGIWLLLLPCLFGIALAAKNNICINCLQIILLFTIGSIMMRSAGCIINDILDRNFDKNVARTKTRPIAAGQVGLKSALILLLILLLIALIILLQFNLTTVLLGCTALLLVVLYPLTKRFTYYPQAFLGITFNFGILMGSSAVSGRISLAAISLYIATIFWTIIYDSFYGYQDIEDDIKIGVKSTAIRFGSHPQKILYVLSFLQTLFLALSGILENLRTSYYLFVLLAWCHLICQIRTCDFTNQQDCLQKFKSNLWVGVIILLSIISG